MHCLQVSHESHKTIISSARIQIDINTYGNASLKIIVPAFQIRLSDSKSPKNKDKDVLTKYHTQKVTTQFSRK